MPVDTYFKFEMVTPPEQGFFFQFCDAAEVAIIWKVI
jgi:hypothetical protein